MEIFFLYLSFLLYQISVIQSLNTQLLWLQHLQTAKITERYVCVSHNVKSFTYIISFNPYTALQSSYYDLCFRDGKAKDRKIKWLVSGHMAIKEDFCPGLTPQFRLSFYYIPVFLLQYQLWKIPKGKELCPLHSRIFWHLANFIDVKGMRCDSQGRDPLWVLGKKSWEAHLKTEVSSQMLAAK